MCPRDEAQRQEDEIAKEREASQARLKALEEQVKQGKVKKQEEKRRKQAAEKEAKEKEAACGPASGAGGRKGEGEATAIAVGEPWGRRLI